METEDRVFPKLEIAAVGIKRTLEREGSLQPAFEELLGTATKEGVLQSRFGFEYGSNTEGRSSTEPPRLPPCSNAGSSQPEAEAP